MGEYVQDFAAFGQRSQAVRMTRATGDATVKALLHTWVRGGVQEEANEEKDQDSKYYKVEDGGIGS